MSSTSDDAQIAQYIEAGVESLIAVIFAFWGAWVGGLIEVFIGRKVTSSRERHRYILWSIALGALIISFSIFLLTQRGGVVTRSDGVDAEYVRQIGIGFAVASIVYAFGQYAQYTFSAQALSVVLVVLTYACATFATLTTTTDIYWIVFAFWLFGVLAGGYLTFVSQRIRNVYFYLNIVIWFLIWIHVILYGLWLILSVQVADIINVTTEAILYAVFDCLIFLSAGLLIGITFSGTESLFETAVMRKSRVYSNGQNRKVNVTRSVVNEMGGVPAVPDQYHRMKRY